MSAISTMYYIQDGYQGDGNCLGTGQQISQVFTAPSLASAQAVAQTFATLFQRNVRLVPMSGPPPYTPLFTANATSLALSNAPSGIGF
jgi:hypothetical protein